jgi:hypothetical protein
MMNDIISINAWPDTETVSVIEVVVGTTLDDSVRIADAIAHALDVWHDERVDMRVNGVDRARYLLERNQECAL